MLLFGRVVGADKLSQAMLLVDRLGRCKLQLLLFICTGATFLCLMGSSFAEGGDNQKSCPSGGNFLPVYMSVFLLFVGRGASNACFSATYVATPELYVPLPLPPTQPASLSTVSPSANASHFEYNPEYVVSNNARYTTNVRATALGVCSSVSRVAGIVCSYASGSACTSDFVVISGVLAIFGGFLSLSLPETTGKVLR
jgi:hypothetical protein